MFSKSSIKAGIIFQSLVLIVFFIASCGGGGGMIAPPAANPGTGNPSLAQSPAPDAGMIHAGVLSGTGEVHVFGGNGAVEAFAVVTVSAGLGHTAATTADESGVFSLEPSALPAGFDNTVGAVVEITQQAPNLAPSDPISVELASILWIGKSA